MSCSGPHESEIYATFALADGAYPGEEAIHRETDVRCRDLLRNTPPATVRGLVIGSIMLFPLEDGWRLDRTVVCVAYDPQNVRVQGAEPIPGV